MVPIRVPFARKLTDEIAMLEDAFAAIVTGVPSAKLDPLDGVVMLTGRGFVGALRLKP